MKRIITITTLALLFTSCATVFQGSRKNVTVQSKTPGASIYIDGTLQESDSVTVLLKRKHKHFVTIKKDGYDSVAVVLKPHIQVGWLITDIAVIGVRGVFALPVDAITGAWKTFDKKKVVVELSPAK